MGSENDKRLKKSTLPPSNQNNNNSGTQNQNPPQNNNMNLNNPQNERINPYDQSKRMSFPPKTNQGGMGGSGQGFNTTQNKNLGYNRSLTQRKNVITTKMLKQAFTTYSIDNSYLNKKGFNDAIESIFRFNIPEMHYTHLSNKIYELLDSSHDGKIQEDEFVDGFKSVLKDRNFRLLLSMEAMMSLPDISRDYIEVNEIKQFFYLSYIEAYKHLGWQIKKNPEEFKRNNLPIPTIQQLGKWAQKFEKEIGAAIDKDLKDFDPNVTNSITFPQFLRWISIDHTIYIKYGNKNISVATSLLRLDDIYFEDSDAGNKGNYPNM